MTANCAAAFDAVCSSGSTPKEDNTSKTLSNLFLILVNPSPLTQPSERTGHFLKLSKKQKKNQAKQQTYSAQAIYGVY
jgi:hypothetical protein